MFRVLCSLIVVWLAAAPVSARASSYSVMILDTPDGFQTSTPAALNNSGTAVGSGIHDLSDGAAFGALLWDSDGIVRDIGSDVRVAYSQAADINESGVVAVTAARNPRVNPGDAFVIDVLSRPSIRRLEQLTHRVRLLSEALGVNDLGDVVGSAQTGNRAPYDAANPFAVATLWNKSGQLMVIGAMGELSWAIDVNDAGLVIGRTATESSSFASGFLWDAQDGMRLLNGFDGEPDLGAVAFDINDAGVYVGLSSPDPFAPEGSATVWLTEAQATALTTLPNAFHSEATGINEENMIVGRILFDDMTAKAVLWTGAEPILLNDLIDDPTLDIVVARDINDAGQILVGLVDHGGSDPVFRNAVLTPIP